MKISLVGSYNLADGYLGAAKALQQKGFIVDFIPAHRYKSEGPDHLDRILADLRNQVPDIVLWWRSETLTQPDMHFILTRLPTYTKHILYSWDDPFSLECTEVPVLPKCKYFDLVLTCCESSVSDYRQAGARKVVYCPPGFDPEVHYPEYCEEHASDISLVCTNFYDDNFTSFPHLNRRNMLYYLLSRFPNLKISLYGNESVGREFPSIYKGWLGFSDSRKVFSSSKINISTHVRPDGYKYINERVAQILGSGGFLLVDNVAGIEQLLHPDKECVVFDFRCLNDLGDEIEKIMNEEDWATSVRTQGFRKAVQTLTWDNWAETLVEALK